MYVRDFKTFDGRSYLKKKNEILGFIDPILLSWSLLQFIIIKVFEADNIQYR